MKTREVIALRIPSDAEFQKRLELAEKFGINLSEAIRESLPDIIDKKIKLKAKDMRNLLQQVPA